MKLSLISEAIKITSKSAPSCPMCKEGLNELTEEPAECDRCGTAFHPECVEDMLRGKQCPLLGCKGLVGADEAELGASSRVNEILGLVGHWVRDEGYDLEMFGGALELVNRDPDEYRQNAPDLYRLWQLRPTEEEIVYAYKLRDHPRTPRIPGFVGSR